jgi:adenosylmethionine-8-amino-7-oxononanoate aminotransferase
MSANTDLLERSLAHVWNPCTQMKLHETLPLVPVARGEGAWLVDFDGHRVLDAVSSWWVNLFGHCNPRIREAIVDQLGVLEHAMLAGFTHAPAVELAERLSALAPRDAVRGGLEHACFASDGASATEIALKLAFHAARNRGEPQRQRFIALERSYHGETLGALSVTDMAIYRDAYGPLLSSPLLAPAPSSTPGIGQDTPCCPECVAPALAALDALLERHGHEVAAMIVEPLVQGAAGMRIYHPDYLRGVRERCDRRGVLLIADEIMTGMGRTGTMFACEQAGITPDLMCLSKGITGGFMPLSVVLATDGVYRAFYDDSGGRAFLHSHSYTGNPLACRAALATLDIFAQDDVLAANRALAARIDAIAAPLRDLPQVRGWRRLGMIWAFEVDGADAGFPRALFAEALARGLLLRPIGATVYFMPPYTLTLDEAAHMMDSTRAALLALGKD